MINSIYPLSPFFVLNLMSIFSSLVLYPVSQPIPSPIPNSNFGQRPPSHSLPPPPLLCNPLLIHGSQGLIIIIIINYYCIKNKIKILSLSPPLLPHLKGSSTKSPFLEAGRGEGWNVKLLYKPMPCRLECQIKNNCLKIEMRDGGDGG